MREQIKQLLKNSVYRTLGETANGLGAVNGDERSLRVLMYHKVNDVPNNRMSMPVGRFDEQMAQLKELGYAVVDLESVLAHYLHGDRLPDGAVLITFDDGYRDNLENAAPVLRRHGYPAVQFVPLAFVGDRQPLPHEEHLAAHGVLNPTVDWEELRELERLGVRIESHGLSHKPLADLELDEAAREIAISKLRLEERLGRSVRAFSYVKGSEAHYKPVASEPRPPGGLRRRLHRGLGREHSLERSAAGAAVQRRAVLAAHVRARARGRLRPDRGEGHRDRHPRAARLQRGPRHLVEVIVAPARRDEFLALMRETYGSAMSPDEFDWWFDRNPAGPRVLNEARDDDGSPLGALAMSCARMSQGLAAFAVHAVTTPAARGRGVFSTLELHNEGEAARAGASWALGFTNPMAGPILVGRLGWEDVTSLRIWARPKRVRRSTEGRLLSQADVTPFEERHAVSYPAHHVVRDAAYLDWRYRDSPRRYVRLEGEHGWAVVTHARGTASRRRSCATPSAAAFRRSSAVCARRRRGHRRRAREPR